MAHSRLSLACDAGIVAVPADGLIAVWRPRGDADLSALPKDRVRIIQGFRPDHDLWQSRGYAVAPTADDTYALSIVMVPRAKAEAHALLHAAAARTSGPIVVDGQKTDGIDSLYKACRKRADVSEALSKAHGKLFTINAHDGFDDWAAGAFSGPEGFTTAPGVFSADRIDHGSRLLAEALPPGIGARVADLGAGWGYLSTRLLERDSIEALHLVEADHAAIECARLNLADPRAQFHWADATAIKLPGPVDAVVMNPPFHTSRAADPDLGRAFVEAAARMLTPQGALWMVANRHLPYEASLAQRFAEVSEIGGDGGFKLLSARRPIRVTRTRR